MDNLNTTSHRKNGSKTSGKRIVVTPKSLLQDHQLTISGLAQVLKVLADQTRLRILLALSKSDELHVAAVCKQLKQTQSAVSHNLMLLRIAGVVGYRRNGKRNYYRIDSDLVRQLLKKLTSELRITS